MEERSAGFVLYRIEENSPLYLLLRSSRDGYWGLPKGNVDPGETDEEAAQRELAEETGITDFEVKDGFEQTITYWFTRNENKIHKAVRYFLAEAKSQEVNLSHEHSEHAWLTLEHVKEKIVFKNLLAVIENADKHITQT